MYGEYWAWAGGAGGCFPGMYDIRNDLGGSHGRSPDPGGTLVCTVCCSTQYLRGVPMVSIAEEKGFFTGSHLSAGSHHGAGFNPSAVKFSALI